MKRFLYNSRKLHLKYKQNVSKIIEKINPCIIIILYLSSRLAGKCW